MGRLRGYLWLVAGVLVAVLAGVVAFNALSNATTQRAEEAVTTERLTSVVVAAHALEVRSVLTAEALEVKELPEEAVPAGAVTKVEDAVGMITAVDLQPGEIILESRLIEPNVATADGRMALVVAEDEVLMAFPIQDLMSQIGVLKAGDHVDFLFSFELPVERGTETPLRVGERAVSEGGATEEEETEQVTFNLLQNVTVAAVVSTPGEEGEPESPEALLLLVSPQDALVLKYMKDAGGVLDVVLRSPGAEGRFTTEPVDLEYLLNGYIIPAEKGR